MANSFLENFHNLYELLKNFEANLNKDYGSFVISLKYSENLCEIKKPFFKILLIWAKNQLRLENFENVFEFTQKVSKGNSILLNF